jgi:hypothetical protein
MRCLLVLCLVSCGRDLPVDGTPMDAGIDAPALDALAPTAADASVASQAPVLHAMHAGEISVVAITDDGLAAVSADQAGGVRLWPSLDGKLEPVVIRMTPPKALALARVDHELAIAGLDEIGQLEVVRVGDTVSRISSDERLLSIAAVGDGFVAVRADRAVVMLDSRGALRGALLGEPGQHVLSVAVRGNAAIALLDVAGKVRGRWIDVPTARWGALTGVLPIDGMHVALSTDAKRIAGVDVGGVRVVDIASGKTKSRYVDEDDRRLRPIAFSRSGRLALVNHDELCWWNGKQLTEIMRFGAAALGGNTLVADHGPSLAIAVPDSAEPEYLGYRMATAIDVLAKRNGFVATDGESVVDLDATFTLRKELPLTDRGLDDAYIIDSTHVVGSSYVDRARGTYVVDLDAHTATLAAPDSYQMRFQRDSGLLTYIADKRTYLRRWERKKKAFGPAVEIPGSAFDSLLNEGTVVVDAKTVAQVNVDATPRATITFFDVSSKDPLELTKSRVKTKLLDASWFDTHVNVTELVTPLRNRLRSPDRTVSAELHDDRITLRDANGTERWTMPAAGATALLWTSSGDLIAYGAGMGRIDLANGRWQDRRCGWIFGRSSQTDNGRAGMCEAP